MGKTTLAKERAALRTAAPARRDAADISIEVRYFRMSILRAYCPIGSCDYWVAFGGHLHLFLRALYQHYEQVHTREKPGTHRVPGGELDQILGEAILARLGHADKVVKDA